MATIWNILLRTLMVTGSCVRARMKNIPSRRSRKKQLRLLLRRLRKRSERMKYRPLFFFMIYRNLKSKMDLVGIFARYIQFSKKNFCLSRKPPPPPTRAKIKKKNCIVVSQKNLKTPPPPPPKKGK